jgi:hypothetical protein
LAARLDTTGSTLFRLTWKKWVTPSGRRILQRRASALRTSGNACTSWPTPNAGPQNDQDGTWQARRAGLLEQHKNGNGFGLTLGMAASLLSSGLPKTPTTADGKNCGGTGTSSHKTLPGDVALVSPWATPSSRDWKDTPGMAQEAFDHHGAFRNRIDQLARQAHQVSARPTPTAQDNDQVAGEYATNGTTLGGAVRMVNGPMSSGSPAQTGKSDRPLLNPRFSLWLQGYPIEWARCAERVTRSVRRSRPSSSKPTPKRS